MAPGARLCSLPRGDAPLATARWSSENLSGFDVDERSEAGSEASSVDEAPPRHVAKAGGGEGRAPRAVTFGSHGRVSRPRWYRVATSGPGAGRSCACSWLPLCAALFYPLQALRMVCRATSAGVEWKFIESEQIVWCAPTIALLSAHEREHPQAPKVPL